MTDETPASAHGVRLAWIRHEIRNPLNVVLGSLRLLEMSGVTPQQQRQIEMCRAAVDRISGILRQLEDGAVSGLAAEAARELGALAPISVLSKPFDREDLVAALRAVGAGERSLRVLAADDSREAGTLLASLLSASGHAIDLAADGADAVERAAEGRFDVILLDLEMPGLNGLDAARHIRARERDSQSPPVPIVMITAHDLEAGGGDRGEQITPDPEIAPLVPEFLAGRRRDIETFVRLIETSDWDAIRSLGHKMKGTGRGYGFARISEIGAAIERAAIDQDAAAARASVDALGRYLDRVRIV